MAADGFIFTLSDADEISDEELLEEQRLALLPDQRIKRKRPAKQQSAVKRQKLDESDDETDGDLTSDFEFQNGGADSDAGGELDDFNAWMSNEKLITKPSKGAVDIETLVARRQALKSTSNQAGNEEHEEGDGSLGDSDEDESEASVQPNGFNRDVDHESNDDTDESEEEDEEEHNSTDESDAAPPVAHPDDMASDSEPEEVQDAQEEAKRKAFFAADSSITNSTPSSSAFTTMNLSRPILKGLSAVGFNQPTPIQAKTIPIALEGKDLVGGAVTGSGKTAAFLIPILERLLFRPKRIATTRVAILMPTRELALQCLSVARKLASFTDITFGQAIGGLNSREQEKELKLRPDIVIATPGRFIDLERNSASLAVSTIEILVLDEADRMLEEGFADELNEILAKIPKSRQTMLFSATMTSKVDDLIRAGLQRPARLMVDPQNQTVAGLVQEFVRLRPGREDKRLACLLHLCSHAYTTRTIVFFRQKKDAHRARVVFALCGLRAAELHGSMTQEQRIGAIDAFRAGRAAFLLATDLASRGLDIRGIDTVVNYEAPQTHDIYLHRVGRTARAGRSGRACTLAAEPDRKVVKAAVKAGRAHGAVIRQRVVAPSDVDAWHARLVALEPEVEAVLRDEREEKALQQADREITRVDNIVKHEDDIKARPKKTWFESEKDKQAARHRGSVLLNGVPDGDTPKKRDKAGKLSNKKKKRLRDQDDRSEGREWKKGKGERMGGREKTIPRGGKSRASRGGRSTAKKRS